MNSFYEISSDDVYLKLIELNCPEETANYFKNEMKDGFFNYIKMDEIPVVKTNNVYLIAILVKLIVSFMNKREKIPLPYDPNDPFLMSTEPWPAPKVDTKQATKTKQTAFSFPRSSQKSQSSTILDLSSRALKPMTSNIANHQQADSSQKKVANWMKNYCRVDENDVEQQQQSSDGNGGVGDENFAPGSNQFAPQSTPPPVALQFEMSTIKAWACEGLITLPKFTLNIEESLHVADECLIVLPHACSQLAFYFMANNMDLRKNTDYRSIADAILNKYEVLQGIIFRKMLLEFKNDISKVKPANYLSKVLSKEMNKLRASTKVLRAQIQTNTNLINH